MQLGDFHIPLTPNGFLQATKEGQDKLTAIVMKATAPASRVLDLFCGIGSYSFPLSSTAPTHAVELDKEMVASMHAAIKRNAVPNLTVEQRDLFKHPIAAPELNSFHTVVINPPRIGAKAQCLQLAQSSVAKVVMISCNPATFARDAKILNNAGFRIINATGIDQFVWSPHLEIAAVFER
jgi:23S rRNA (uracil1939-C5)-methyltransferase